MADGVFLVDVTVHGQPVARFTGPGEDLFELGRRIPTFVGVEPDSEDPVFVGQRCLEGLHCRFGRHVAQEAHDETALETKLLLGVELGTMKAVDDVREGNPA